MSKCPECNKEVAGDESKTVGGIEYHSSCYDNKVKSATIQKPKMFIQVTHPTIPPTLDDK
ncbi:hypothetical protein D3C81_411300 [compost metagenome]